MPVGDAELNARGLPRKRARQTTREDKHAIIEEIRQSIRLGYTDGEMKRAISKKHKLKPRSVEKYIAAARKRNLQYLGASEDENLSASLAYWTRKKQEAESFLVTAMRGIIDTERRISEESGGGDAELFDALNARLEGLRKTVYTQEQFSREAQKEIDRLKGVHAPVRHDVRQLNVTASVDVTQASDEQLLEWNRMVGIPVLSIEPVVNLPD